MQAAISANGKSVIIGNAQAPTVGIQIANQVVGQPGAPTVTAGTGDSSLAGGTYKIEVSLVNSYGEVIGSAATTITITSGQTLVITAPTVPEGQYATGWNVYCTAVGGSTYYLQNSTPIPLPPLAGAPTTYTLSSPPVTTTANPPAAPAFVGTLSFSASVDGFNFTNLGTTTDGAVPWPAGGTGVNSATAPGTWTVNFAGLVYLQVESTAWTSGMAVVTLTAAEAM